MPRVTDLYPTGVTGKFRTFPAKTEAAAVTITWTKVGTSFKYDANTLLTGDRVTMLAVDEIVQIGIGVLSITTDTTLTTDNLLVLVDATSGNITVTLPTAVGNSDHTFCVKKIDSSANTVTIKADGIELVEDESNIVITDQYEEIPVISDNVGWWIK